jgi:hypothetical protein
MENQSDSEWLAFGNKRRAPQLLTEALLASRFVCDKPIIRYQLPVDSQEKTSKNCLSMVEPQEKSADPAQRNRECEKPAGLW